MLLLTLHIGGDRSFERAAIQAALERQVEGIIFASIYHRAVEIPPAAFDLPLVLVDCFAANGPYTGVVPMKSAAVIPRPNVSWTKAIAALP